MKNMIFKELEIDSVLTTELDKIIANFGYDLSICDNRHYDEEKDSFECYERILFEALYEIRCTNKNVANEDENVARIPKELIVDPVPQLFEKLVTEACEVGDQQYNFNVTGRFWYPKNGYMGWHTNNTFPGYRFYCTHAQESGLSFFRYIDPETSEIITSWDKVGWMGRIFKIDREKPLWHCVYSETNRISIGCNLEVDTNFSENWEKMGGKI